jgi:hypothetical protein
MLLTIPCPGAALALTSTDPNSIEKSLTAFGESPCFASTKPKPSAPNSTLPYDAPLCQPGGKLPEPEKTVLMILSFVPGFLRKQPTDFCQNVY